MNILLITAIFGMLSGMGLKIIEILKEHRQRLSKIEDFLFGEVISTNEVDD